MTDCREHNTDSKSNKVNAAAGLIFAILMAFVLTAGSWYILAGTSSSQEPAGIETKVENNAGANTSSGVQVEPAGSQQQDI